MAPFLKAVADLASRGNDGAKSGLPVHKSIMASIPRSAPEGPLPTKPENRVVNSHTLPVMLTCAFRAGLL